MKSTERTFSVSADHGSKVCDENNGRVILNVWELEGPKQWPKSLGTEPAVASTDNGGYDHNIQLMHNSICVAQWLSG